MKRYDLLHKRVRLKDGRTGEVVQMLSRIFVKLDIPILKYVGKKPVQLGEWVDEKDVEAI